MFDFFRNLAKSAPEKRQELVNAYLDGELTPKEARRFEVELDQDPALRAELAQLRQIKRSLQQLPQVRAPRNYTLDPAVYGVPAQQTASQWQPALRVATVLTAFFFILTVALDVFTVSERAPLLSAGAQEAEVADVVVEEVEVEGEAVAVTRVVTEMAEEPVEEEVEMAEDAAELAPPPTDEAAASALAIEESEEAAAEEIPEEVEEEAAGDVAVEEAEAEVADEDAAARATAAPPGAGGGPTSLPTPSADESGARQAEVMGTPAGTEAAMAVDETATALFFERGEGEAEVAQAPEGAPVEPSPSLSLLRVAQIVLGLLLATLLVAWALAWR